MGRLLKNGELSESTIQELVVSYLVLKGYETAIIQIYNEGYGRAKRGNGAHKLGFRKGASDLFISVASRGFNGFWLELKSKNGKLSAEQKQFQIDQESRGYFCATAWSFEQAKEIIDSYL